MEYVREVVKTKMFYPVLPSKTMAGKNSEHASVTVPEHILDEWEDEADEMNISRSEYIRIHTEAGRKELSRLHPSTTSSGETLTDDVLSKIPEDEAIEPEKVVEEIIEPLKNEILNEILPELDDKGEIQFSPAEGGYMKK